VFVPLPVCAASIAFVVSLIDKHSGTAVFAATNEVTVSDVDWRSKATNRYKVHLTSF
jgi:hypothetical protein